jgi:ketosteroid isomerase-like protein
VTPDLTTDDLVTIREIEHLKYRYLRALDLKDWEGFMEVFEPDATGDYGEGLQFECARAIVDFMRGWLGPDVITVHQVHQPEIALDESGRTASGTWMLMDRVIAVSHRVLVEGASVYRDEYRRGDDGRWRIAHTGYERIYESTMSLEDWPSWKLTANRFG